LSQLTIIAYRRPGANCRAGLHALLGGTLNSNTNGNKLAKSLDRLQQYWGKSIVGKPEALRLVLISLLCRGHLLLEDVPGLGKTTLAKVVSRSIALSFKRLQCTPDLLPADISGVSIFDQKDQAFRFVPGPIFSNILLADEINRTSPRTQSALLEAMAERTVTMDRKTRALPQTFMVIATQNPIEFSGTYPLPEAQLDRFFMRVSLGYPSLRDEARIMAINREGDPAQTVEPVLREEQLLSLQEAVKHIKVDPAIMQYIASLVQATRTHRKLRLGASPRGSIALMKAAQALAMIEGSDFATARMVQRLVQPVLAHRLLPRGSDDTADAVLQDIIQAIPVPAMPAHLNSSDAEPAAVAPAQVN
jgi:MoxR-like ATPase